MMSKINNDNPMSMKPDYTLFTHSVNNSSIKELLWPRN